MNYRRVIYITPCENTLFYNQPVLRFQIANAVWWYYFSKLLEFCDTFFFILRKKHQQLTFLHVYHHSTMFMFWWIGIKWVPSGSSKWNRQVLHIIHWKCLETCQHGRGVISCSVSTRFVLQVQLISLEMKYWLFHDCMFSWCRFESVLYLVCSSFLASDGKFGDSCYDVLLLRLIRFRSINREISVVEEIPNDTPTGKC